MKKILFVWILMTVIGLASAQVGGLQSYTFLLMPNDARVGAIGGVNVSTAGKDVSMFVQNPAALTDSMSGKVSFTNRRLYADVAYNHVNGAFNSKKIGGTWGVFLTAVSYGDFKEFDHLGNSLGTFRASENVFGITKSHKIGYFHVGATAKFASSSIASYRSNALLLDVGGQFVHPTKGLIVGFTMKNAGFFTKHYREDLKGKLPFDVQLGASYKFEHAPIRFSLQTHNLTRYDVQYLDPIRNVKIDEDGNDLLEEKKTSEKIARHIVIGTELIFSEKFQARIGYNHMMRKELKAEPIKGGAGFSFGFMIKVYAFEFNFTRVYYHLVGGNTMLTVTADLNRFYTKK